MRWRDIDYLCHGITATVVYETEWDRNPTHARITRTVGIIDCPHPDQTARLVTIDHRRVFDAQALVILHVPEPEGAFFHG